MKRDEEKQEKAIKGLIPFMTKSIKRLGSNTIKTALLLYFAYKRKETPSWAKRTILASLAYLISPIDLLPDIAPIIGFTDDIGVLSLALGTVALYINDDVREMTEKQLQKWNLKELASDS